MLKQLFGSCGEVNEIVRVTVTVVVMMVVVADKVKAMAVVLEVAVVIGMALVLKAVAAVVTVAFISDEYNDATQRSCIHHFTLIIVFMY